MDRRKWVHCEWAANYNQAGPGLRLVATRYGTELHSEESDGNNSGAIERSNQRAAIRRMEEWATANGYAGLVWEGGNG